ncbi:MAG: AI-2E family transporter [Moraxellaceae bacterium]|nr:AI-2E family transporter [Moraxellaceae bacterium]MDZ4385961.1 AI-2E family transporter [Moraxellaceae bacterium]
MKNQTRWMILAGLVLFGWLIHALQPILLPFLVGALFAYLGNPLVHRLMRFGWSRITAVSVSFVSLSTVGTLLFIGVIPKLWSQLMYLQGRVPEGLRWINRELIPWLEQRLDVSIGRLNSEMISDWAAQFWQVTGANTSAMLTTLAQSGMSLIFTLGLIALIPIVTFYLMLDWDNLIDKARGLLPRKYERQVVRLVSECDEVLAAFLRGQLLVMISLGIIYGVGLQIMGLKLALMIGIVAGLASIIPYLGFVVGISLAIFTAVFQYGFVLEPLLWIGLVFMIGQAAEAWVLQPWLIGDRIGLPPVGVIFAIMAGGQLFGFVGMLLALPMAAVIMVLLRHAHRKYIKSSLYVGMDKHDPS